jgi:predicted nucleic acid-binding protein
MAVQTAVLDACVLHPATLRNFLLRLAEEGAFIPVWSDKIVDEFVRAVVQTRHTVKPESMRRTVELMNGAFPDARVAGYGKLIKALRLPDPDDRHVLAAAIKAKAAANVTFNSRHFPAGTLADQGIVACHPDAFVDGLLKSNPGAVERAFGELRRSLKNPPVSVPELLAKLEQQGMMESGRLLRRRLAGR